MSVRVKICGITNVADAEMAVEAGADALGFVLWPGSPRHVPPESLAGLVAGLPPRVQRVGVFVEADPASIAASVTAGGLSTAQLHGNEDVAFCRGLEVDWYRAFKVSPDVEVGGLVAEIERYGRPTFMLDTAAADRPGGTGRRFDWKTAALVSMRMALAGTPRLILAGGLDPGNVREAIRLVRPWAVDVSSGVEAGPGRKDPDLVRAFIDAVRSVE